MAGGPIGPGARRAGRRRFAGRPMAEINVTPFVDVMLVLLIIFMVAAPLLTVGVPLELPETRAEALPSDQETPLTVTMDGEGRIFVQETVVTAEQLVPRLGAIAATRESDRIFLRADRSLGYGEVMVVMGALSGAGFRNIGLVTDAEVRGDPTPGAPDDGG